MVFRDALKTCGDNHRNNSLEHLALNYQLFKAEDDEELVVSERQNIIWNIIDEHYKQLTDESLDTPDDKTWRLYLARMDRRKMKIEVENKEDKILINFNPEINSELRSFSEESSQISSELMKFSSLKLWSHYRYKYEEDKYKQYQQYENDTKLVMKETKEIVRSLKNNADSTYSLFNYSIPAYTCSVLIRDFYDLLNLKDKEYCKNVIIKYASKPLINEKYNYQIDDGTEPSIVVLPYLIRYFPNKKDEIKSLLLLLILNPWSNISTFAERGILNSLWEFSFTDAHSIFIGYLLLQPQYDKMRQEVREENNLKRIYNFSEISIIKRFIKKYGNESGNIGTNAINFNELKDLDKLDSRTLITAFEILPLKTKNDDHYKFISIIFPILSKILLKDDYDIDYIYKNRFFNKLANFVLTSEKDKIEEYIKPFIDNYTDSRDMSLLFQEFITVEDQINHYDEFWIVWNAFFNRIVEATKRDRFYHHSKEIIRNYLLAWPYWKEEAKEWHSLKNRDKIFYMNVASEMGHHPSTLFSISKILNSIGSILLEEGISWICNIIENNNNLQKVELEVNTIYYIENYIRKYISVNRKNIKVSIGIKNQVLTVLNFIIEKGSVTGYLLREDIL
ncbi:MAG: hypothetical protein NTV87_12005 [Ignavibacteriae bacterium]|nr:hypothetical protein [Ignavibacteriota bacterium]